MDLTLIRHAQAAQPPSSDAEPDPALSERGSTQAKFLADYAARWKRPTAVFSSPARRAQKTAEPLAAAHRMQVQIADWLEEVNAPGAANLDATRAAEHINARAMSELRARTAAGLGALLRAHGAEPAAVSGRWKLANDDTRLVLVGHGMALAVALEWLLDVPGVPWAGHRFQFGHAAFARVRAYPFAGDLVFGLARYNAVEHVPREARSY
jgi:broad specificity phosphatase PhoE